MAIPARIENRLKLRHLALAVAVHDLGSLRRAAEALNITQPAATSALQELEHVLGTLLFTRSKSGMQPTVFGGVFVERSRAIVGNVRSAVEEVQQLKEGIAGEVVVGTLPSAAMTIIPDAVRRCRQVRPGIVPRLIEGSLTQLLPALAREELDFVVGRIPTSEVGPELRYEAIACEPNEVVCRVGHPLASRRKLTLRDLVGQEWVVPAEGSHTRQGLCDAFARAGLERPVPSVVTSSMTIRLAMIATSDMLGILARPVALIQQAQGALRILDVAVDTPTGSVILVTRAEAVPTPAAQIFADHVRQAAAEPHDLMQPMRVPA